MTQHTHQTAPTQFVDAAGVRFAYRRFGKTGGAPLVFNMHFTGTMDHWDPAVTDGLAQEREVILFDNAGISRSSGEVPNAVEKMAADAAAFIRAVGLTQVDVLGFSLGGLVAQELALAEPQLVRRLILVGTGPRSGEGMASLTPEAQRIFGARYDEPDHLWLEVFFTASGASQAAGDVIVYSVNSWILQQQLPNAQLILYPDANHGSQYQYPERFVRHVSLFLSEKDARG